MFDILDILTILRPPINPDEHFLGCYQGNKEIIHRRMQHFETFVPYMNRVLQVMAMLHIILLLFVFGYVIQSL